MSKKNLGIDAYSDPTTDTSDLLKNLDGCTVHRISAGVEEHAGTALLVVELPTGEGLGVQVSMDPDGNHISTYSVTRGSGELEIDPEPTVRTLSELETGFPEVSIEEVAHHNIMDPDTARVVLVLSAPSVEPYALDMHIHGDRGTEFFEVPLDT
jgi:hypothetical protein